MTFSTENLAASLATYLAQYLPGVAFYPGPNQQATITPSMFLQQRYAYTELRQAGRWLRRIGLDLTYLLDYNLPDMQLQYQATAEQLDLVMETFPYTDASGTTLLRTYDRESRIDMDALHYTFELQVWVALPEDVVKMQTMDYSEDVIYEQNQK